MKIFKINETKNHNNVPFERKPNAKEMQIYTDSINQGLSLLNKQLDIIIHNSAAPSVAKENTGIGSLFSRTVQTKLIPFLKAHGFSGIQQEPNNLRKNGDPSPYAPESSAKNIYMIPLEKLTGKEYGYMLPKPVFDEITSSTIDNDSVNYAKVNKDYDNALRIAYNNFKRTGIFAEEFEKFKSENNSLEKDALFRVLSNLYNTSWEQWDGIDKKLFSPNSANESKEAQDRIVFLKNQFHDDIEYFYFQQFLLELENKTSNKLASETGVKIIGDSPVASPASDEWAYQNLYLEGKAIGCPPDYFSSSGQRWGFKYFNPKYIFNPDGTLGKAGKLMKEKYDAFFASFPGGLRLDHTIGLVDPFIYTVDSEKMTEQNSGRIYSVEGEFKKKKSEYSNILENIILQSAKEHGMDKTSLICEDLGDPNIPTMNVMKDLDLSGVAVTQFDDYRGKTVPERNVIMIGSHDNPSFIEYTENLFDRVKGKDISERSFFTRVKNYINSLLKKNQDYDLVQFMKKTKYLAEDTAPKGATKEEIRKYKQEIRTDKKKFIEASFAELFTSPARRVQIFFADFWGLGKTYNRPGTQDGNWTLRIGNDFENNYYKAVTERKAPNLANAIATALRHRGIDKTNPELINNLENSARILSEV